MAHVELPTTPLTGYQDLTVGGTVVKLTPPPADPTVQPTTQALVQVQRANVRVRFDGGVPTTNSGFLLQPGDAVAIQMDVVNAARWVADGGTGALLSVSYFA